jgi:hypothetical protein
MTSTRNTSPATSDDDIAASPAMFVMVPATSFWSPTWEFPEAGVGENRRDSQLAAVLSQRTRIDSVELVGEPPW